LALSPDTQSAYRIGLAVIDWLVGRLASPNKYLAQMNKSPDGVNLSKRYRPDGDVGEAKNQHTSPTAAGEEAEFDPLC